MSSDSDYTDEELPSTLRGGRASLSQSQRTQRSQKTQIDPEKIDELSIKMFNYILNFSTNKIPIKKAEMVKSVLDKQDRLFNPVMDKTGEVLKEIFGYRCVEVPNKKPKQFIVVSTIPNYTLDVDSDENDELRQATLLFIILSFIFMKGGKVKENVLWMYILKQLGVEKDDDADHYYFGDVKKTVNELFIKQLYLSRDKVMLEGMQDEIFVVSWGERAEIEFSKKDMLAAVCSKDMLNKPERYYIQQYIEAAEENEEQVVGEQETQQTQVMEMDD